MSRYCSKPTIQHWNAVKRILRYLRGTSTLGIAYHKQHSFQCSGYSDADWAGDVNDRKSTSGYCFKINGGVVSWRSCKQNCVALSTAEAEYVSLAGASQEAIWIVQLLSDLNVKNVSPIVIFEDNKAAACIGNNPTHHPRTKLIDIKYHFVRDQVINDKIQL